jgi:hypothetical protein
MGATENWIIVRPDGTLVLHTENDGMQFMRRGPEAIEQVVTLEELQGRPHLLADAKRQLADLAERHRQRRTF